MQPNQRNEVTIMSMGLVLFLLMAALEIVLVIMTCVRATEKKLWRKNRLFVRIAEIAANAKRARSRVKCLRRRISS